MRKILIMLAAAGMSFGVSAQDVDKRHTPFSSLDAWATYGDIENTGPGGAVSGDSDIGFGARLSISLGSILFVRGSLQNIRLDSPDAPTVGGVTLDQIRLTETRYEGGLRHAFGEQGNFTGFVTIGDYRPKLKQVLSNGVVVEGTNSGTIYGVGGSFQIGPSFAVGGGYSRASLDNADYDEFNLSALYQIDNSLGIFLEYRDGEIDGDDTGTVEVRDIRLGLRFSFGGSGGGGGDDFF
jgi:hypothetical protein